ncbi:hypothetical protein SteCoe_1015 [Stentor coeruleus]|uniref:Uncharacterized protein n=1 Tax=Stentor coeruleus TaxID=5963 RepID=A0A1R2D2W8_9CILI|nr:hypothetical protein SteCoe_1015 [Stentor coeruleus]
MSIVSPRIQDNSIESYCILRPKHPKVVETLQRLNNYSPYKVVSDLLQPKTGDLHEKFYDDEIINSPRQNNSADKKEVTLAIGTSKLLARRNRK